jgi:uncharacterized membrane protein
MITYCSLICDILGITAHRYHLIFVPCAYSLQNLHLLQSGMELINVSLKNVHARKIFLLHSVKPNVILTALAYVLVSKLKHRNYTKHLVVLNIIIVRFCLQVIWPVRKI